VVPRALLPTYFALPRPDASASVHG
jgi:hypothetical protein